MPAPSDGEVYFSVFISRSGALERGTSSSASIWPITAAPSPHVVPIARLEPPAAWRGLDFTLIRRRTCAAVTSTSPPGVTASSIPTASPRGGKRSMVRPDGRAVEWPGRTASPAPQGPPRGGAGSKVRPDELDAEVAAGLRIPAAAPPSAAGPSDSLGHSPRTPPQSTPSPPGAAAAAAAPTMKCSDIEESPRAPPWGGSGSQVRPDGPDDVVALVPAAIRRRLAAPSVAVGSAGRPPSRAGDARPMSSVWLSMLYSDCRALPTR